MLYEVEATLTFKRESIAEIVQSSIAKRKTASTSNNRFGTMCHVNAIFYTKAEAKEFIDWLYSLNSYLKINSYDENCYMLKTVQGIVDCHRFVTI